MGTRSQGAARAWRPALGGRLRSSPGGLGRDRGRGRSPQAAPGRRSPRPCPSGRSGPWRRREARLGSLARWLSPVGARTRCGLHRKCPAAGLAPRRLRLQRLPRRPSLKGAARRPGPPWRVLKGPRAIPSLPTHPLEATPAALDATPLTLEAPPAARRPCGPSRPGGTRPF